MSFPPLSLCREGALPLGTDSRVLFTAGWPHPCSSHTGLLLAGAQHCLHSSTLAWLVLLLWLPLLESSHARGKKLPSLQETQSGVPPLCSYLPDLEISDLPSPEDPWVITTAVP